MMIHLQNTFSTLTAMMSPWGFKSSILKKKKVKKNIFYLLFTHIFGSILYLLYANPRPFSFI
jgi:hypothetical protein